VIADLDTLLTALYIELTDRIIASTPTCRRGPGRPPEVSDAELVCLAVAQVLLRFNDERHWLGAAPSRVGQLFPRLLSQSDYHHRLKTTAWLMEAALGWLADNTPGSAELLRLLDATPVPCGQSTSTVKRSDLFGGGLDVVREALGLVLQALIDAEACQQIGADRYQRSASRTTHRNGSRSRLLSTKAGDVELRIPKLREGSCFPSLLEPRRRIDRALLAVVMEA
jgi:Transposase, Mutator family